jgi:pyruvate dehydrogenase (quinone)
MMMGCDTLLVVGSSFPYSQFLPPYGQARAVQIDLDAKMIGLRYPMEVNLVGDAAATLRALRPLLARKEDRSWQDKITSGVADWWKTLEARAQVTADPINPQALFWALSERLPEDAMVTADSGTAANWYARDLRFRPGMRGSVSGTLATMGCGVPYAIGAKYAHPDRPAIAVVGDGAMQMNGMAELITIGRYWPEWTDPRLVVIVLNNRDLNQVTWEQRAMGGEPKFEASQPIPDMPYAEVAKMAGLLGIRVERPDDIPAALDTALAADRPCVLDILTDPEVPTLPPHIDVDQARKFTEAILKGDSHGGQMMKQGLKDKLAEHLPR